MRLKVNRRSNNLAPRSCVLCGSDGGGRACCDGCSADLPWIGSPCRRCGTPLPQSSSLRHCRHCRAQPDKNLRVLSALVYEYPVDRMISAAKFQQRLDVADALGNLLAAYLCGAAGLLGDKPEIIVPVPLHRRRLAARGYNQAAEIAAPIAACLGLPLWPDACIRIRHTSEQSSLTGRSRRQNLTGAFVAQRELAGRRVAIVDDVFTTGTTVNSVAAAMMATGVAEVQAWTVARTGDVMRR